LTFREVVMGIDVESIAKQMVSEAAKVLGKNWDKVRSFAEPEFKKIALTVAAIEAGRLKGDLSDDDARALLDIQKNATRSVLTALEVIGIVTAEKAINAALAILETPLKALLGIA
jgi:transcription initiation factor IIE alpha subunit